MADERLDITVNAKLSGTSNLTTIAVATEDRRSSSPTVAAAKPGTLATRTDANTGVLTMSSGHGFQDADVIDVFWSGGSRRGMTVGTVSVNSIPIDGGSGDDLPSATTVIAAMVPHETEFVITGDDSVAITANAPCAGYIAFLESGDVDAKVITFDAANAYLWSDSPYLEGSNPLAGKDVVKVTFSHGQLTAQPMRVAVFFD